MSSSLSSSTAAQHTPGQWHKRRALERKDAGHVDQDMEVTAHGGDETDTDDELGELHVPGEVQDDEDAAGGHLMRRRKRRGEQRSSQQHENDVDAEKKGKRVKQEEEEKQGAQKNESQDKVEENPPAFVEDQELITAIVAPSPMVMVELKTASASQAPKPRRQLTRFSPDGPLLFDEHYIQQVVERERRDLERERRAAEQWKLAHANANRRRGYYGGEEDESWALDDTEDVDEDDEEGQDDYDEEMGSSHSPRKQRFAQGDYNTTTSTVSPYFSSTSTTTTVSSASTNQATGKRVARPRRLHTSPSPDSAGEEPDDGDTRFNRSRASATADDEENTQEDSMAALTLSSSLTQPTQLLNVDPAMEAGPTDGTKIVCYGLCCG